MGVKTRLAKSLTAACEDHCRTVLIGQFRQGVVAIGMRDPTLGLRVGSSSICRLHVATSGKGPTTIRTKMVTQSHDDVAKKRGDQRASGETPKLVPHNFREDGDRQPPVDLGRRQSDANDDVPEPP